MTKRSLSFSVSTKFTGLFPSFLIGCKTFGISCLLISLLVLSACSKQREDIDATNATLAYLETTYGSVRNPELDRLLQKISRQLLSAQTGLKTFSEYDSINVRRTASLPWQVHVIGDRDLNAFAIGSGYLVITKGMILSLDTEAKLAAVIAHEMSHELLDHTTAALGAQDAEDGIGQQYQLEQEIAADRISALLLHAAGYDPKASIEALVVVHQLQPQSDQKSFFRRVNALRARVLEIPKNRPYIDNTRQFNRATRLLRNIRLQQNS